jgi:hypothetical protein
MNTPYLINGCAFSPFVILSEAKDLTPALYLTHYALCARRFDCEVPRSARNDRTARTRHKF